MSAAKPNSTGIQDASARIVAVAKDARTDAAAKAAAAEALRKKRVAEAMARLDAKSKDGTVDAAKARIDARTAASKRAAEEEKVARAAAGASAKDKDWVKGYYREGDEWVQGHWRGTVFSGQSIELGRFKKSASAPDTQRLALAAVYMPDVQDSQGDYMSAEEIRKMMWAHMAGGDNFCVDINHDGKVTSCQVVESFIVRKGDPDFPIPGTWVVGIHVPEDGLWGKVLKGELNGVSMEGVGRAIPRDAAPKVSLDIICKGYTATHADHEHTFEVTLDSGGRIVGGTTSVHTDASGVGHSHNIVKGVVTEEAAGHRHRFTTLGKTTVKKFDAGTPQNAKAASIAVKLNIARGGELKAIQEVAATLRALDDATLKHLAQVFGLPADGARIALLDTLHGHATGKPMPKTIGRRVIDATNAASRTISDLTRRKTVAPKTPVGDKNLAGFALWWNDDNQFEARLKDMRNWNDTQVRRAHNLLTGRFVDGTKEQLIGSIRAYRSKQMVESRVRTAMGKSPLPKDAMRPNAVNGKYFVKPYQRLVNGKWVEVDGYWVDPKDSLETRISVAEQKIRSAMKRQLKPAVIAKKPPISTSTPRIAVKPAIRVPKPMVKLPGALGVIANASQLFMKTSEDAA